MGKKLKSNNLDLKWVLNMNSKNMSKKYEFKRENSRTKNFKYLL